MSNIKKVIIVGGVAGGASVAARLRRLSEDIEITIIQRGRYVSFANCGLPYHIGGEIENRESLLIQTPQGLYDRFNINVRTENEVLHIDRKNQELKILDLRSGEISKENYDALVLSPGAEPIAPPLPGINRPGNYSLRSMQDMDDILEWNEQVQPKHAVVVGGGYIGLEMTEQLSLLGMKVSLVEANSQLLTPIDNDMAKWLEQEVQEKDVQLYLNQRVKSFDSPTKKEDGKASTLVFEDGSRLSADLVILSIGVKPEVDLAKNCGLAIGELGGIRVNDHMRTDDPNIWAVGDAIEVRHPVTHNWALIPLAGPANRQARVAANCIMGRASRYRGTWGTSIVRIFDLTTACSGLNEKQLKSAGMSYKVSYVHPYSHVSYYPNAEMLLIKLLFSTEDGTIYGAQVIGKNGVARRMDVLATAIQGGLTVNDLAQLELCYAPAFGAPKDAVNMAGMVARNIVNGDISSVTTSDLQQMDHYYLIDVSTPEEFKQRNIPNAINIPIDELRSRLDEIPRDKKIVVNCYSGQRSYFAYRIMTLKGFDVCNLSGGFRSWQYSHQVGQPELISNSETDLYEKLFNQAMTYLNDIHHLHDKKSSTLRKREVLVNEKERKLRNKLVLLKENHQSDGSKLSLINDELSHISQQESNLSHEYKETNQALSEKYCQLLHYQKKINTLPNTEKVQAEVNELSQEIEKSKSTAKKFKTSEQLIIDKENHVNHLSKITNKQSIALTKKEGLLLNNQSDSTALPSIQPK